MWRGYVITKYSNLIYALLDCPWLIVLTCAVKSEMSIFEKKKKC